MKFVLIHQKTNRAWREVLVATNTEEDTSRAKVNPDETTAFHFLSTCFEATSLQLSSCTWPFFPRIPESTRWIISGRFLSILQNYSQCWRITYDWEVFICGLIFYFGGDHAFGGSFREGSHKILTWQKL